LVGWVVSWEELGDRAGLATTYNNIGGVYLAQGNLPETLTWAQKSLAIVIELNAWADVAQISFNVGIVHLRLGQREEAWVRFKEALALYERLNLPQGVAQVREVMRQAGM
jgi:tetratricopeptide (TPR) repeat protein